MWWLLYRVIRISLLEFRGLNRIILFDYREFIYKVFFMVDIRYLFLYMKDDERFDDEWFFLLI